MDKLKINTSLITNLEEYEDSYKGRIYFPAFRKECVINIINGVKQGYFDKVLDLLLKLDRMEIKKACRVMLSAYNDYYKKYGVIDNMPVRLNVDNIMDYMGDITVTINNDEDNILYYVVTFDKCYLLGDLWLDWAFINNKLVFVGEYGYQPGYEKESWNYLIEYSKDINLTEEEYLELEKKKEEQDKKERETAAGSEHYYSIEKNFFSIPAFLLGTIYLLMKGCIEIGILFCLINILACYFLFPGGYIIILLNHFVLAFLFRYIYYYSLSSYSKNHPEIDNKNLFKSYEKRKSYLIFIIFAYLLIILFVTLFGFMNTQ